MTPQAQRSTWAVLVILGIGFTIGNFLLHGESRALPSGRISAFTVGERLPALELRPVSRAGTTLGNGPLPRGCRVLVTFDATCPHCGTAADLDKTVPDSVRLPVIWVSAFDDSATFDFASHLNRTSVLRYGGGNAFKQLQAHGVPAAFLVSADDRIIWTGAYAGGISNHVALRRMCTG